MEWVNGEYVLVDDKSRLDIDTVCRLLADTYWAAGRPREVIEHAIRYSVCFGLFHKGQQVGFARAVTDHATFTWICDVIIHPDHRGRGLGKWMLKTLLEHPNLQTSTHALRTKDAHGLYEQFGFQPVEYLRRSTNPV
jgi:GNAT superfamily N-acetyltransferase